MMPQDDGMQLDPQMLVPILNQKIGEAAIREAQLEAVVMQLQREKLQLEVTLEALKTAADEATEEKS